MLTALFWLLFSDADVVFKPDLLSRALSHAGSEKLDVLTVMPRMEMQGFGDPLLAPSVGNMVAVYLPGWLINAPTVRIAGAGGGVFFAMGASLATALRSTWVNESSEGTPGGDAKRTRGRRGSDPRGASSL